MAGFSQGEIDQYSPGVGPVDYSFLNYAISNKESQYERGVNSVKNVANSVLNAPLTNPDNISQRDQYFAQAQTGLKALSKTDLSDQRNVAQAGQIFAPFYQDQDILHDMSTTKQVNSEIQKGLSASTDKDKDVRSTYNPESIKYLQGKLQDLSEAKRGDGSIQNIHAEAWTPFTDVSSYLNKAAKDQGLNFEQTIDGGWQLYKITGGQKAIIPYTKFAESQLGPEFNQQFKILGSNEVREKINTLRSIGYTKQDAQKLIGEDNLTDFINQKKQYIVGLNADKERAQLEQNEYTKNLTQHGGANPNQDAIWQQNQLGLSTLDMQINKHQTDINSYLDNTGKLNLNSNESQTVINNPDFISAEKIKTNLLSNWATGRAMADYKSEITPNQAYANKENFNLQTAHLTLEQDKFEEQKRQHQIENQFKIGELNNSSDDINLKYLQAGYTRGNNNQPQAQDPLQGATNLGQSSEQSAKTTADQLYDVAKKIQKNDIINSLYSTDSKQPGISSILSLSGILNPTESAVFNTYMKQVEMGEKPNANPEINNVIKKLYDLKVLKGSAKPGDFDEFKKLVNTNLLAYAHDNIERVSNNLTPTQRQFYLESVDHFETSTAQYNSEQEAIKNKMQEELKNDKDGKYSKATINDNGTPRFVNAKDLEPYIKNIGLTDENGNPVDEKMLSEEYLKGNVKTVSNSNGQNTFIVGNKTYIAPYHYDQFSPDPSLLITSKFGESKELKDTRTKLYNKVNPYAGLLQQKTGKYANDFELIREAPTTNKVINSIVNQGNYLSVRDDNGHMLGEDSKGAIRNIGLSDDKILNQIVGNVTVNPVGYGETPTVTLHLNSEKLKNEQGKVADPNLALLIKNKADQITFEIDPNTTNSFLKKVLSHAIPPTQDPYQQLKEGKSVTSSPLRSKLGSGYTISPSSTDPRFISGYNVEAEKPIFNYKTGEWEKGLFKKSYPTTYDGAEIVKEINQNQEMTAAANQQAYDLYTKAHPKVSVADLEKKHQEFLDKQK